jgi:hypothetical protein
VCSAVPCALRLRLRCAHMTQYATACCCLIVGVEPRVVHNAKSPQPNHRMGKPLGHCALSVGFVGVMGACQPNPIGV